ncbi:MAG: hypothetical protein GTO18_18270 [Anaerolineales bacterium]|nr:hypothetical protein [Anaerolineales bacterium]
MTEHSEETDLEEPEFDREETEEGEEEEEFGELLRYTLVGYLGGLALGVILDNLGYQTSAVGQWLVRTIAGESESILEGIFALRKRLSGSDPSMAQAYGWGKFIGMTIPWWIDWGSRALGVDVYGVQGFYIPYFYGMSDQIGASVSGILFLRRKTGSWISAIKAYFHHPVMVASLVVILLVPSMLIIARLLGFSPTTQVLTALEMIAANLCWVPPFVGWLWEKRG